MSSSLAFTVANKSSGLKTQGGPENPDNWLLPLPINPRRRQRRRFSSPESVHIYLLVSSILSVRSLYILCFDIVDIVGWVTGRAFGL